MWNSYRYRKWWIWLIKRRIKINNYRYRSQDLIKLLFNLGLNLNNQDDLFIQNKVFKFL